MSHDASEVTPPASRIRSVLVVDDDDMVRLAMVRTLQAAGYRVRGAALPGEAVAALAGEHWDMVISDLVMPEMTGLDLLELVRRGSPTTLRLLLTGDSDGLQGLGGDLVYRCLPKPWDNKELRAVVSRAFEHPGGASL